MVEAIERLATASPGDAPDVELRTYKGLVGPWNDWSHLSRRGRYWAAILAGGQLSEPQR